MTKFLIKLFIKNKDDVLDTNVRNNYSMLSAITGIICNLLLFIVKLIVGILSFSVAIIDDAFNNISDAGSSVVAMIGVKVSDKHADKKHPLGHGRFEYICAFIVDMLIIFVAVELFKSSIEKIIAPELSFANDVSLILLGVAVLVKVWLFVFYRHIAKKIDSSVIKASSIDSISDAVATTVVLASALVARYAGISIDGWAGLLVAILIFFSGINSAKETVGLLLGSSPDPKMISDIYDFVKKYPEVINIHDVMVHDYGPGRQIISFHAEVPSDIDFCHVHDVIDNIERDLHANFNYIATIHLDPIVINDQKVNEMREFVEDVVKSIDEQFTIHDFRMTYGGIHKNLIFDLCIPVDSKYSDEEASKLVEDAIKSKDPNCFAVIKPEHPFI